MTHWSKSRYSTFPNIVTLVPQTKSFESKPYLPLLLQISEAQQELLNIYNLLNTGAYTS